MTTFVVSEDMYVSRLDGWIPSVASIGWTLTVRPRNPFRTFLARHQVAYGLEQGFGQFEGPVVQRPGIP